MDMIKLPVTITEDRRLLVDLQLPEDTPTGEFEVEMTLRPMGESSLPETPANKELTREQIREILLKAGALVTDIKPPEGTRPLTFEERLETGKMPPGSPPVEQLVREDRGEF